MTTILTLLGASAACGRRARAAAADLERRAAAAAAHRLARAARFARAARAHRSRRGSATPCRSVDRRHQMCCWNGDAAAMLHGCRLEPGASSAIVNIDAGRQRDPIRLESGDSFFVLYRVEQGQRQSHPHVLGRLSARRRRPDRALAHRRASRATASRCSAASRRAAPARKLADSALSALAMHADASRARHADHARAQRADSTHVRGQALFWLAQRAGEKAVGTITDAIDKRSGDRGQEARGVRAQPAAEGRGRAAADQRGAHQRQSGRAQAGDVLARPDRRTRAR